MDVARRRLIELYLSNLRVRTVMMGSGNVGVNWKDLDYTPDYNKFYLIQEGEGLLRIGELELRPQPGQLVLMPEGVRQSYTTVSSRRYTKLWCHFTAKIGSQNLFDLVRPPWIIDTGDDPAPFRAFEEMLEAQAAGTLTSALRIDACLLKLVAFYLERAFAGGAEIARTEYAKTLHAAIAFVETNFRRNIAVQDLAEMTHMHPNSFIRLFKKHFGTTPIRYINVKRIEEAKWLLSSTNLTLSDIGERVGIPDIFYLSKLFKQITGLSPSMYKTISRTAGIST